MAKSNAERTYDLVFYDQATESSGQDNQSTLWLSYGDGLGGFLKPVGIKVPGYAYSLITGDFDGDGNVDIVDSASSIKDGTGFHSGLGISLSNGHGGFKYHQISGSAEVGLLSQILPTDVDGDGDLDILARSESGPDGEGEGQIAVYINKGHGKFANPVLLDNPDHRTVYSIATLDYDKDGDQDLYAILDDHIVRYENNGNGSFTQTADMQIDGTLPDDLLFVDIDGDGKKEIVTTSGFQLDFVSLDLQKTVRPSLDLTDEDWAAAIAAGDMDNDGDPDLVSVNNTAFDTGGGHEVSSVSIYTNDGKGHFKIKTIDLAKGTTPDTIQLVDIDHDGDLDILASDIEHASLVINNGHGKYTVTPLKAPPHGFVGVVAARVNDSIEGKAGNDKLDGTDAADLIRGNAGNDQIYGGKGADEMSGGAGDDRFIFTRLSDSAAGANHDLIDDFRHHQDRLDVSALNPHTRSGKFSFIGEGRFDHHAGEIRFLLLDEKGKANDHTIVEIDFDGDRKADMQIELGGLVHLDKGDFVL